MSLSAPVCVWSKIILWRLPWTNKQSSRAGAGVIVKRQLADSLDTVQSWLSLSLRLWNYAALSFFFSSGPCSAIFQPLDTPFVWTQALKLIKFVACQWKRHSIKQTRPHEKECGKNEKLPLKSCTQKCLTKINEWDDRIASNWSACRPCATLYSNQVKRINVDFTLTRTWRTLTSTLTLTLTVPSIDGSGASATSVVASRDCDCDCDLKLGSAGRENEKLFAVAQCTLCILLKDRLYNYGEGMGECRRRCSLSGIKCVCAKLQSRRK